MCQGASMSLSQCVSEGGQVLVVHRDVKEPNVCLHEQDGGLGGAWTTCLAAMFNGLLLLFMIGSSHSHWGSVCTLMPSDGSHMSVCVDQLLSYDNNEPSG